MNLRLYAEKIAVKEVKEELQGSIVLPEHRHVKQELGEVLAVGDGKYRTGEERPMFVKPGDIVMYQLGGPQMAAAAYKVGDQPLKIFHQGDAIARLKSNVVTLENFEILGNWVLMKVEVEQSLIHVPEKHATPEQFRFTVQQVGEGFAMPGIKIGSEVFAERAKCAPIEIDGITYVYTVQDFIHGVLIEDEPSDAVPTPSAAPEA
jgi:co-chaperonin GroES (HSP10)